MKTQIESGRRSIQLLIVIFLSGLPVAACRSSALASAETAAVPVDARTNVQCLLDEEDTDNDKRITVDDDGDRRFWLVTTDGRRYEVSGTYYLSNLLQELKLAEERGDDIAELNPARLFENPVDHISRSIRQLHWDGLTRRIDEENVVRLFTDTKTTTVDGFRYLYVPFTDDVAYDYFAQVAEDHPDLRIKVVRLPEIVTPQWVRQRNGYHGILTLALRRDAGGQLEGVPFVVPGGRFNEMYGWDSYFEALGLLRDGRLDLAQAMVDNFVYEIDHYGKILNANRTYYLTRSQPPFLTSMALAVYDHLPKDAASKDWLRSVMQAAIKEYEEVWMGPERLTATGLSRYYGEGIGPPPEVEPGHFDADYAAMVQQVIASVFDSNSTKPSPSIATMLQTFFTNDRSMRESGHDRTHRWDDRCANFVTVDLNSLLYKIEMDIAQTIESEFADAVPLADGRIATSASWYERAARRKRLMNQYLWDSERGLFFDYDLANERRKVYVTPVAFYPLWAGLATPEQAASIVKVAVPALEMPGGLVASTEASRGPVTESRPARQWDYPNGWAPHQMLAWQGLHDHGYDEIVNRLTYRWLYTITRNATDYNGTIPEKFDVVNRSHRVFAEYGNVGTDFAYITREGFGWMNASFQVGLAHLPPNLRSNLEQLIPPEWLFGR